MSFLNDIRALQQCGLLTEAITLSEKTLAAEPNNPALLALLGTLYCQQQNFEKGRECLEKISPNSQNFSAETLTDIAAIHLLLKEPVLALQKLEHALQLNPEFYLAQTRRGLVFMQLGRFSDAQTDLQTALTHSPITQHAALHINIARCALFLGENETALTHVETAQTLGAAHLEQWLYVAVDSYIALNLWEKAESAVQHALEAGVAELKAVKLLALILAAQDKHDQAAHSLRNALKKHPEDVELFTQLAALARVQGRYGEVVRYMQAAIKLEPENASLWSQLAQLGQKHFDENGARLAAEKAIVLTEQETGIARAEALVAMASVTTEEIKAEDYYQQALQHVPDYVPASLGLGHLLLQWGRIDEAIALFENITARHPVAGYGALINARRFPDDVEVLAKIETMAYIPSLQGAVSSSLLFDLAAAYEHRKEYDKAFHFAHEANAASRKFLPYDAKQHTQHCSAIRHTFNQHFFQQTADYGNPSELPTFVLGMPRSGTTLVEQILGGHPEIFVAGEIAILSNVIQKLNAWERHLGSGLHYPDCVRDLTIDQAQYFANEVLAELRQYAPNAKHIVDKLPHNFEHIGLIRLLFPNAPIIHVLREPRDVAVSNYFVDYQAKFGGMGFAYDLADIGLQLRDYQALMQHWDYVLAKPVLTIRYEDVVADTESAARKILAYLQLEWTDAVLNYQNLERAVKTASVWQVRQPIYNTSTEKWRRYQDFLQPLEAVLNAPIENDEIEAIIENLPAGYFFQGMAYLRENKSVQAAEVFQAILSNNPHHASALHMLGISFYQQKQLETALKLVKKSIALHPHHANWYQNLGAIYAALGMKTEAQAADKKAKNLKTLQSTHDDFWQMA